MKIAFIGHKRIPSNETGVERVVENQSLRLMARGYEPVIYNRSGESIFRSPGKHTACAKEYKGMRMITVPAPKGPAEVPVYSFLATLHACFTGCDAMYYHASGSCNMIRLASLLRKPSVAMIHGIDSNRAKWGGFASWYLKKGEKAAALKADRCLVLSRSMKQMLIEEYGTGKNGEVPVVTVNGIDIPEETGPEIAEAVCKEFGLKKNEYILSAGRITPEKGFEVLIRAFRKCGTGMKLVIAGGTIPKTEEYYSSLKELADGDERIVFAGHVDQEKLAALYDNAYVFVLPSYLEGMAMALIEAMAHGCCCITSDIEENTQVTGKAGASFRTGDAEDLAVKLRLFLDDGDLVERLGIDARERIRSGFSWDTSVEQLDDIFRNIAGKR